jgi:hypothetical protein
MEMLEQVINTITGSLKSVMFQDLALQQGASQLQTASADRWTFLANIPFQWMIYLPLLNPTKLHH